MRPHLNPPLRGEESKYRISNIEFRIKNFEVSKTSTVKNTGFPGQAGE
jgi:hypothetical protein